MINIRYHIVSITAVFLALGIGVALGSTFLDQPTVALLNRNIRGAEARIDATEAENSRLDGLVQSAAERDRALLEAGGADLLGGTLVDVPVLVVAAPGVRGEDLLTVSAALERAGADHRGILQLRSELALVDGPGDDLTDALDLDASDPAEARSELYSLLGDSFAAAGGPRPTAEEDPSGDSESTTTVPGDAPATTTTTTEAIGEPEASTTTTADQTTTTTEADRGSDTSDEDALDGAQPEVMTAVLEAGLAELTPGPGRDGDDPILEATGYRYVFLGGPDLDATANDLLLALLPEPQGAPIVVVSATVEPVGDGEEAPAPTVVARVRASAELSAAYGTVDDVDTFAGLVSTVLSLQRIEEATPGHFGEADGATSLLPPPA